MYVQDELLKLELLQNILLELKGKRNRGKYNFDGFKGTTHRSSKDHFLNIVMYYLNIIVFILL